MKDHKNFSSGLYLTLQDVADVAGVSKPAVANWRKRHDDFPAVVQAVSSERQPKFSSQEVFAWLLANNKVTKSDLEGQSTDLYMKALVTQAGRRLSVASSAFLALGLVYFAHRGVLDRVISYQSEGELVQLIEAMGLKWFDVNHWGRICATFTADELDSLVSAALKLAEEQPIERLTEEIIDALSNKYHISNGVELAGCTDAMPALASRVADAQQQQVESIYDPMIGLASTAVASVKSDSAKLYGADIDLSVLAVAELRLALNGIEADLTAGDTLKVNVFPRCKADFAFVEGPWGLRLDDIGPEDVAGRDIVPLHFIPKSGGSQALTVVDVVAHLSERGWAYVLTPFNIATSKSFERFRHALVAQECVAAIIQLPGGLAKGSQIPLLLWVLRAPGQVSDSVAVVDASGTKNLADDVALAVSSIQQLELPTKLPSRWVSLAESLSDSNFSWLPSVALKPGVSAEDVRARLAQAEKKVGEGLELVAQADASFRVDAGNGLDSGAPVISLADLSAWQVPGAVLHRDDILTEPRSEEGVLACLVKHRAGLVGREQVFVKQSARVLEPGDVVVWTAPSLRSVAVPDDGNTYVVKGAAHVYRLETAVWSPKYFAAVINHQTAEHEGGSFLNRVRLQNIRVRRVNLLEQERIVQQFEQLAGLQEHARDLVENTEELMRSLADVSLVND